MEKSDQEIKEELIARRNEYFTLAKRAKVEKDWRREDLYEGQLMATNQIIAFLGLEK